MVCDVSVIAPQKRDRGKSRAALLFNLRGYALTGRMIASVSRYHFGLTSDAPPFFSSSPLRCKDDFRSLYIIRMN